MARQNPLTRWPPAEWAGRVALALAVLAVGYYGALYSAVQAIAITDPVQAYRLSPRIGPVAALYAEYLSESAVAASGQRRAATVAQMALRRDQTTVTALAVLGINADSRGDKPTARRLFGYAHMLSRRDLLTQLWLIQDAVDRGQVAQALHHYDITLRVIPNMWEMFFPVLTAAISTPQVRAGLIQLLAQRPPWSDGLMVYIAGHGHDPVALYDLFVGLQRAHVAVVPTTQAAAINALLSAGQADAAWAYYAGIRPGATRDRSRDPHFTSSQAPSLLDWVTVNDNGAAANINGGLFDFTAPASGGSLLQQYQLFAPGNYQLEGHSSGISQAVDSAPYWTLTCRDGRELGRIAVSGSTNAGGRFVGTFVVPADCPIQILTLIAKASDTAFSVTGQIHDVRLARQP